MSQKTVTLSFSTNHRIYLEIFRYIEENLGTISSVSSVSGIPTKNYLNENINRE
jgi:hypothetical protein